MKARQHQRKLLAEQAARAMSEYAIDDPSMALRRVLNRQSSPIDRRIWPESHEILAAYRDYQRLFHNEKSNDEVQHRKSAALEAMRFLSSFRPRLVGNLVDDVAESHATIQLHLHSDSSESILWFLSDNRIEYRLSERRVSLDPQRIADIPVVSFEADGTPFQLWLLPLNCERQAPLGNDNRTPIARRSLSQLLQNLSPN